MKIFGGGLRRHDIKVIADLNKGRKDVCERNSLKMLPVSLGN